MFKDGKLQTVRVLPEHGADMSDSVLKTAINVECNEWIIKLLIQHIAKMQCRKKTIDWENLQIIEGKAVYKEYYKEGLQEL